MFFYRRKAQGLPINVLILAALGLVILIIMGIMFAGKTKTFAGNLENCRAKFGTCETTAICDQKQGSPLRGTDCDAKNTQSSATTNPQTYVCCISPLS